MNKRFFCSRRPVGGVRLAAIAPTLRTAKPLQKKRLPV
jgi:hypothetical protein